MTAAEVQDIEGGVLLLAAPLGQLTFLRKLFVNNAYKGPVFREGFTKAMPIIKVEIIKRSDCAKGFVVEPKCWIVEQIIT